MDEIPIINNDSGSLYASREYLIFNVSEIPLVDFNYVMETSAETLRRSVDGTKTFIKWESQPPGFISEMTTKEGPYTHDEILVILATPEWTNPDPYM
jgi:hypothetical protein